MLEPDGPVDQCEQGVIAADTDIVAGMDSGASLPDEDVPRQDSLTVGSLYAESLGLAVPFLVEPTPFL